MKKIHTFEEFLNENVKITGAFAKSSENSLNSIEKLKAQIYDSFYEVYDDNGENEKNIPELKVLYKKLAPVITEGDDAGLLIDGWVNEELKKIEDKLIEISKILETGKSLVKKHK
jgi:hypothetical protein